MAQREGETGRKFQSHPWLDRPNMSSSFWIASDDEWDDDIYSSESETEETEVKPTSRFAGLGLEEDDEDSKRVTRSASEKTLDELNKCIKVLKSKMFINDWISTSDGTLLSQELLSKSCPSVFRPLDHFSTPLSSSISLFSLPFSLLHIAFTIFFIVYQYSTSKFDD